MRRLLQSHRFWLAVSVSCYTWIFLCVLLLAFCNGGCSTIGQAHGASVHGNVSAREVARMVVLTQNEFRKATGQTPSIDLAGWAIEFYEERVDCSSNPDGCHGLVKPLERRILLKQEKCVPMSSLAHELCHLFLFRTSGDWDTGHENRKCFGHLNAVEYRAMIDGISEGMCL